MIRWIRGFGLAAAICATGATVRAAKDTGEFNFQGQLKLGGVPVTDACDFEFTLWRDETSDVPIDKVGPILTFDGVGPNPLPLEVANGLFSAVLDFGHNAFTDDDRWVEVAVRCPAGVDAYVLLSPRTRVTGAPHSIHTRGILVDDIGRVSLQNDLHVAGNVVLSVEGFDPHLELRSDDAADATRMFLKTLDTLGFAVQDSQATSRLFVADGGGVGVGPNVTTPETLLHVEGQGDFRGNHIAYFESVSGPSSDGIAIQLDNQHTNRENNFITFYNGDEIVTGRIEGFDFEFGDWIDPPPLPTVGLSFDPGISYNEDWFDPGSLPTANLTPGSLPTANFNTGSLPTATFNPGTLPSLSFSGGSLPSLSFSGGTLPSLSFSRGSLPSLSLSTTNLLGVNVVTGFTFSTGSLPSATFSTGSLPSATFSTGTLPSASLNRGQLPSLTFSGGSLPSLSFSGGSLPSLSFSGGSLPSIDKSPLIFEPPSLILDLPTEEEWEALICWSLDHDIQGFLALDPVSRAAAALKATVAQRCKDEGVTYGSKGADYAEWLPKVEPSDRFQLGQIVGVHGGRVSLKTRDAEQIMAISTAPVVVGNVPQPEDEDRFVTVGFMGQLPVVVRGKVRPGDYIIPSGMDDGTAIAVAPENLRLEHLGQTLGRAWSPSDNDVFSLVDVVIGLPGNEAKVVLQRHARRLSELEDRQMTLAEENTRLKNELAGVSGRLADVLASVERLQDRIAGRSDCRRGVASATAP